MAAPSGAPSRARSSSEPQGCVVIASYGDAAVIVSPPLEGSLVERARSLAALASSLRDQLPSADIVQGGSSLLVLGATTEAILAAVAVPVSPEQAAASHHDISVIYDGPDLAAVAERARITPEDVVRLHGERTYTALVTGFLPGFAYLGEVDPRIAAPRLATPRKRVAPGAVGIAGSLTGVYPFASPGGWNLIASAIEPRLFDQSRDPPRRIGVLDTVRFVPAERAAVASSSDVAEAAHETGAPALEIGRSAPIATVQDRGRFGFRGRGLPWSGALDRETLDAANAAVGNDTDAAAIEIPLASFEAIARSDLVVSIDGEP
ncbi:MAG: carboxyltransferase domain-containing protein, partial [Polyangiaceae bacterium]|nr:carboxyltransferase domain-containing protein [Polyangiaceae bacterium]